VNGTGFRCQCFTLLIYEVFSVDHWYLMKLGVNCEGSKNVTPAGSSSLSACGQKPSEHDNLELLIPAALVSTVAALKVHVG
jgi:hypothetical protein